MRSGVTLELERDHIVYWLGVLEREIARDWATRVGATEVPLSGYAGVKGWRRSELDATTWLPEGQSFVGFLVPQGVFGLVEYGQPVIKRLPAT